MEWGSGEKTPASGHGLLAYPDAAVHEGASGDYGGLAAEGKAKKRLDPPHLSIAVQVQVHGHAFPDLKVWGGLQQAPHDPCILMLVRLRTQSPHSRALRSRFWT